MGFVLKNQPIGIDKIINKINSELYSNLTTSAGWTGYEAYHRAYRNDSANGIIPEVYTGESIDQNDYKEAYLDDRDNASSFFLVSENNDITHNQEKIDVEIYFKVKLTSLYSELSHRADEEARNDVKVALKNMPYVSSVGQTITGIRNVYSEFRQDNIKYDDMQPFHVFKINITINPIYNCYWTCEYTRDNDNSGFQYYLNFGLA